MLLLFMMRFRLAIDAFDRVIIPVPAVLLVILLLFNIKVVSVLVSSFDCVSSFSSPVEEDVVVVVAVAIDMVGAAALGALLVLLMVEAIMLSLVVLLVILLVLELLVVLSILASGCCILNAVETISFTGTLSPLTIFMVLSLSLLLLDLSSSWQLPLPFVELIFVPWTDALTIPGRFALSLTYSPLVILSSACSPRTWQSIFFNISFLAQVVLVSPAPVVKVVFD
mmetsp:Transcript_9890/g.14748  ORF Transcript_9890/g.14748 Transcript_9890/m.14748 type:complete len:225 (-) Transcript_9890:478-1152(-)